MKKKSNKVVKERSKLKLDNAKLSENLAYYRKEVEVLKADKMEYLMLLKTLDAILSTEKENITVEYAFNSYRRVDNASTLDKNQSIVAKIVKLKEEFAREDEGTKCQAEQISNLTEALHISLGDPLRALKLQQEHELIKNGYVKNYYGPKGEHFNWVKGPHN